MITFFRALGGASVDFMRHGCTTLAASITFFSLLSLLPMVFLLLNAIGFFVSQDQIDHEHLLKFLQGFFPNIWPELAQEIQRVASERTAKWVVLLSFGWFGLLVFYEVEYAVHIVFSTTRRNPFLSTIRSFALLGLFGALLVLSFMATQAMQILVSLAPRIGGLDILVGTASQLLLSYFLPFLLLLIAVTFLYRYLPQNRPSWRQALCGGILMSLMWEAAKHLFTSYVQNLSVYGRMYGSLITVVLFLLWIYYTAALFLFGAALVHRLQKIAEQRALAESGADLLQESEPERPLFESYEEDPSTELPGIPIEELSLEEPTLEEPEPAASLEYPPASSDYPRLFTNHERS